MSGVNKVILLGYLGSDPELRYTQSGQPCANFNLATNKKYTDKAGKKHESTQWHRIVAWGKTAEACAEHLSKGSQAYIEGELQTRKWEKDGVERCVTEIVAREVIFIGGKVPKGESKTSAGGEANDLSYGPPSSDDDVPF